MSSTATLTRIEALTADVMLYSLDVAPKIQFIPGQFVNLAVPDAAPRGVRSYSVWSGPDAETFQLCIKLFPGGAASEHLRARVVGDVLSLTGPFGVFTLGDLPGPVTMVATGTGLAPFHSMLVHAANIGDARPFHVYLGVRSEADVFGLDALDRLRDRLQLRVTLCLSRPTPDWSPGQRPGLTGFAGRVSDAIAATGLHGGQYLLCGNGSMVTELRASLKERGVERQRIRYEKYY